MSMQTIERTFRGLVHPFSHVFIIIVNTTIIFQGGENEAIEGDPKYLAPEILNQRFGPPADIFSLGMTILELATDLDLPKQGDTWQKLRQGVLPPAASRKFLTSVAYNIEHEVFDIV